MSETIIIIGASSGIAEAVGEVLRGAGLAVFLVARNSKNFRCCPRI